MAEVSVSFLYSTNDGLTEIQQAALRGKLMKLSLHLQGRSTNVFEDGIKGEASRWLAACVIASSSWKSASGSNLSGGISLTLPFCNTQMGVETRGTEVKPQLQFRGRVVSRVGGAKILHTCK